MSIMQNEIGLSFVSDLVHFCFVCTFCDDILYVFLGKCKETSKATNNTIQKKRKDFFKKESWSEYENFNTLFSGYLVGSKVTMHQS